MLTDSESAGLTDGAGVEHKVDDGKDSFQKFTHLGQAIDNQRLSLFGLSVH